MMKTLKKNWKISLEISKNKKILLYNLKEY